MNSTYEEMCSVMDLYNLMDNGYIDPRCSNDYDPEYSGTAHRNCGPRISGESARRLVNNC